MTSPYASVGPRLRENDISAIPVVPGDKMPGKFTGGAWRLESAWQRFCERLPTRFEMDIWPKWQDAGVCVALGPASAPAGMQLVAVDEDTEDPAIVAAIRSVVPPSPLIKKGRKGQTSFYLASLAVKSKPFNDGNRQRLLDLLCAGRQTVLPPSIHPNTGQPYVWLTRDTLEDFDVAGLPTLPDDIVERLAEALKPFGHEPEHERLAAGARGDATLEGDSVHRALNDAALANLDAWVPELQLHGCWRTGDGRYKAVAHWRPSSSGRPLAKRATNLIISAEGIRDKGAEQGYTPIDLVMAACGCDLDTSFRWLQERVAPPQHVTLALTPPKEPEASQEAPEAPQEPDQPHNVVALRPGNLAGLITPSAPYVPPPAPHPEPDPVLPAEHCTPAGLLGEVVEWINATAAKPLPHLNLGVAIALLGAAMGRKWESPTRARTNFYVLGLAVSGAGKDHPQHAARTLALASGMDRLMAAEETKSDSAIRKMLERWPVSFMIMDEMGGWLRKVLDRRAAAHDKRMRDLLLTFFSRANGDYMGSEGATERAVMIRNPHLCVFGASTPDDLWDAFDSASGKDGFLARFLIFDTGDARPARVKPAADVSEPPKALVSKLVTLMDFKPPGGNLANVGAGPVKPIRATWGQGAEDWFEAYEAANNELADRGGARGTCYARAAEHVLKLALVQAVGCDPRAPMITCASLEWAQAVVECSMAALFRAMDDRVADTDKQREYQWVLRTIREGGGYGVPAVRLKKLVNGKFDKRRFDDIISQAMDAGEIESINGSGPGGGRPSMRYRVKMAEEDAA